MFSHDIGSDPQVILLREALLARGVRAVAVLPLLVAGDVAGVLVLYTGDAGVFKDAEEVELLHELAGDIAFGLDHLRKAERLDYLAYYDALTGLANRSLFHERLTQFVQAAQRGRQRLALCVFDIDHFKNVNDVLGRQAGDALLAHLAQRLAHSEDAGRVARLGADAFALVLPDIDDVRDALRRLEATIAHCVGRPFLLNDTELRVSTKVGIAVYPADGVDGDALFHNAEVALKRAKAGGERYLFYAREMSEHIGETLALESRLRRALENDELVLYYQPKLCARGGVTGVEALIRWRDPSAGVLAPPKFIRLLEEIGLMGEVGTWAVRRAVEDSSRWKAAGIDVPRIAVNVSAVQLRQPDFIRRDLGMVQESDTIRALPDSDRYWRDGDVPRLGSR